MAFVLLDTQMETCSLKTQAQVKAMHTASTYSLHSCKDYTATFNVEKKKDEMITMLAFLRADYLSDDERRMLER